MGVSGSTRRGCGGKEGKRRSEKVQLCRAFEGTEVVRSVSPQSEDHWSTRYCTARPSPHRCQTTDSTA